MVNPFLSDFQHSRKVGHVMSRWRNLLNCSLLEELKKSGTKMPSTVFPLRRKPLIFDVWYREHTPALWACGELLSMPSS
jgi:hypothetical protein